MSYNSFVYDLPQEFTYKEVIDPISVVHFRTIQGSYDGSFGFDWLRIDESLKQEPPYQDIIEGGYKSTGRGDLTKKEAYEKLTMEYERGKINYKPFSKEWYAKEKYYSPYLNLFSKEYSDTIKVSPAPTYKARLAVLVKNSADIDKFEFEYNEKLFSVDISQFQQINWETSQAAAGNIEITCLKDFSWRQYIDIYAHPINSGTVCEKPTLAGRIVVMPNSIGHRKEMKFVFVGIRTKITNTSNPIRGEFKPIEILQLRKICYQTLVNPQILVERKNASGISVDITLDLTNDSKFKVGGQFVDSNSVDGSTAMMQYIRDKFQNNPSNSMYKDSFLIFIFGFGHKQMVGRVEDLGVKNVILFMGRNDKTMPHESLHGFNLYHTHRDETPLQHPNIKYIYPEANNNGIKDNNATDNIMSYNGMYRLTTWKWQWDIIKKNI